MATLTQEFNIIKDVKTRGIPQSERGRALFTVDWFLHGHPVKENHDNASMTIRSVGK
jgi:hypothetical protein